MMHLTEEQLVLHYYSDADDDTAIEQHLVQCGLCRASYQELQRDLALIGSVTVPERPVEYGARLWQRLRPHLKQRRWIFPAFFIRSPRWALAGSVFALMVAAFLLGRFWPRPETTILRQPTATYIRERILLASISDHLERSRMLLTELANMSGKEGIDISAEQHWVSNLLEENRIYRQSASRGGEPGMVEVLEDLERILMEIEHSPPKLTASELAQIQQRVEEGGILFKVQVIGSHMREQQKSGARQLRGRSS